MSNNNPSKMSLRTGRKALRAELEQYLRDKGWPYVAVDDAKKAIFASSKIDAFDFIIYSSDGPNLLVLVVTRKPTLDEIEHMRQWQYVFGDGFQAVFVFQVDDRQLVPSQNPWRLVLLQDLQEQDWLTRQRPLEQCLGHLPDKER